MSGGKQDWRWERRGCRVYATPAETVRPRLIANVCITGCDEAAIEARGRLIAAAPDLLEALVSARENIVLGIMAQLGGDERDRRSQAEAYPIVQRIDAALQKPAPPNRRPNR